MVLLLRFMQAFRSSDLDLFLWPGELLFLHEISQTSEPHQMSRISFCVVCHGNNWKSVTLQIEFRLSLSCHRPLGVPYRTVRWEAISLLSSSRIKLNILCFATVFLFLFLPFVALSLEITYTTKYVMPVMKGLGYGQLNRPSRCLVLPPRAPSDKAGRKDVKNRFIMGGWYGKRVRASKRKLVWEN